MNIHNDIDGAVGVWGSVWKLPTILVQNGIEFHLIQFDSDDYYNEWMQNEGHKYAHIKVLYETDKKGR